MRFALFDQIDCSCDHEDFRLEEAVITDAPRVPFSDGAICQKFCGFKQQPVPLARLEPKDCYECRQKRILGGVVRCSCGQAWPVVDGMPRFPQSRPVGAPSEALQVIETDPETDPRWKRFVGVHPEGSIYHHPGWLKSLEEEYPRERLNLACQDEDGQLLAILPMFYTQGLPFRIGAQITGRRLASLPRTPLGGPLSIDQRATAAMLRTAVDRVSLESGVQMQLKMQSSELDGLVDKVACTPWRFSYVLELPRTPEQIRFGDKVHRHRIKWAVNKATKEGLRVRVAENESDLRVWYPLYLDNMRRNSVPPRPYRLFEALWHHLQPRGLMQLLIAERAEGARDRMYAGSILLSYGSTTVYAFTGCRKKELALHPNDLIQWHAIHDACRHGFRWYDFGEVTEDHQLLAQFKSKWGAVPIQLYRYYYPAAEQVTAQSTLEPSSLRRLANAGWQHLPLRVTAAVGDWIYSYL